MNVAYEKNGLVGGDIHPWHIRGNFRFFDRVGKLEDEGVYEEWWLGPAKYKRSFMSKKSSQTDYATGTALFREGTQEWLTGYQMLLRENLINPLPARTLLEGFKLMQEPKSLGKVKLECVSMQYPVRRNVAIGGDFFPAACFDPALPVLRLYSAGNSLHTIYDQIVAFQGHFLAKRMYIDIGGKLAADLSVDTIESLKDPSESLISPPPTASVVDLTKFTLKTWSTPRWPELLKNAIPEYPEEAKLRGIRGSVAVHATIEANGHLDKIIVISGPAELQQSARTALSQWVYRPFELMGQPRAVDVEINVIFALD